MIAKAKENKAQNLDLGKTGLMDITDELFELTWLEELNFSDDYWDIEII